MFVVIIELYTFTMFPTLHPCSYTSQSFRHIVYVFFLSKKMVFFICWFTFAIIMWLVTNAQHITHKISIPCYSSRITLYIIYTVLLHIQIYIYIYRYLYLFEYHTTYHLQNHQTRRPIASHCTSKKLVPLIRELNFSFTIQHQTTYVTGSCK